MDHAHRFNDSIHPRVARAVRWFGTKEWNRDQNTITFYKFRRISQIQITKNLQRLRGNSVLFQQGHEQPLGASVAHVWSSISVLSAVLAWARNGPDVLTSLRHRMPRTLRDLLTHWHRYSMLRYSTNARAWCYALEWCRVALLNEFTFCNCAMWHANNLNGYEPRLMDITRLRTWFKLGTGKCYTESHDSGCSLDRRHWVGIYIDWAGNPNEILKNPDQKVMQPQRTAEKNIIPTIPTIPTVPTVPTVPSIPTQSWSRMIQDDPGWPRIVFDADSAMLIRTFGCWFRWRWFDSIFFDPEIIRFKEKPRQWLPFYCIPFSKVFCLKWCQNTLRKPMWIREVLFPPWQVKFPTCIFENDIMI